MNSADHVSADPCAGKINPRFKTCIAAHRPTWKPGRVFICPVCGRRYKAESVPHGGWLHDGQDPVTDPPPGDIPWLISKPGEACS